MLQEVMQCAGGNEQAPAADGRPVTLVGRFAGQGAADAAGEGRFGDGVGEAVCV